MTMRFATLLLVAASLLVILAGCANAQPSVSELPAAHVLGHVNCIYKIICRRPHIQDWTMYVGQSTNCRRRMLEHRNGIHDHSAFVRRTRFANNAPTSNWRYFRNARPPNVNQNGGGQPDYYFNNDACIAAACYQNDAQIVFSIATHHVGANGGQGQAIPAQQLDQLEAFYIGAERARNDGCNRDDGHGAPAAQANLNFHALNQAWNQVQDLPRQICMADDDWQQQRQLVRFLNQQRGVGMNQIELVDHNRMFNFGRSAIQRAHQALGANLNINQVLNHLDQAINQRLQAMQQQQQQQQQANQQQPMQPSR
eukprot:TRINITY_DN65948_c6_g14_i1.p1 TRINITY_DN65948_c6_g14~~TRINITY_DN65948_c6_g14_i1.p1  ORF type:complete len:324 (-),score=79.41 TRINITY_DN65948_c6_g14_i1:234-1166(-)